MTEGKVKQKRVLVGVSGGVDSAVTLALLKNDGYAVEAIFLCLTNNKEKTNSSLNDAKEICGILNLPLHVVEAQMKFNESVVRYFLNEYAKGRTPNPCVFCNENVKFKLLLENARKMKIGLVATGHYVKIKKVKLGESLTYKLFQARDERKDQSYFLYRLKQRQLARTLFPLGSYDKNEVRELAKNFNLPVFDKVDSQDVCFVDEGKLEKYLAKKIKLKKGQIINTEKTIVGEHRGLALYTIGQRKGIDIGGTGPYFVVTKNVKKNLLIVTNNKAHPALFKDNIALKKVSWVSDCPGLPLAILVRTRYHNSLERAIIKNGKNGKGYVLEFEKPQRAISPGQSAVFYRCHGEVLGGGIIY